MPLGGISSIQLPSRRIKSVDQRRVRRFPAASRIWHHRHRSEMFGNLRRRRRDTPLAPGRYRSDLFSLARVEIIRMSQLASTSGLSSQRDRRLDAELRPATCCSRSSSAVTPSLNAMDTHCRARRISSAFFAQAAKRSNPRGLTGPPPAPAIPVRLTEKRGQSPPQTAQQIQHGQNWSWPGGETHPDAVSGSGRCPFLQACSIARSAR